MCLSICLQSIVHGLPPLDLNMPCKLTRGHELLRNCNLSGIKLKRENQEHTNPGSHVAMCVFPHGRSWLIPGLTWLNQVHEYHLVRNSLVCITWVPPIVLLLSKPARTSSLKIHFWENHSSGFFFLEAILFSADKITAGLWKEIMFNLNIVYSVYSLRYTLVPNSEPTSTTYM